MSTSATQPEPQLSDNVAPAPFANWNFLQRAAFRFGFAYWILYSFPQPFTFIPYVDKLFEWYEPAWQKLIVWTGQHVFHLAKRIEFPPTGSGDTLSQFVRNFLVLVFAAAAMVVWSALDRRRANYQKLHEWLRLFVRLVLGATLLSYGAAKVIKTQFPDPGLFRLLEPYGDSSPMGLLWTFMGYSRGYNLFTGGVEMLGGALLFIPRLTTLGALVSAAAMTNVFILNMCYDVPVKIYSLNLLLMAVFLLLPEFGRLTQVFVLNRIAAPVIPQPIFNRSSAKTGLLAFQLALLLWVTGDVLYQGWSAYRQYGDASPKPALYGIYAVDEFTLDGQLRPPIFSDASRWRRVIFERYNIVGILPGDGPAVRYTGPMDAKTKTMKLTRRGEGQPSGEFSVDSSNSGLITMNGELDGKKIQVKLRRLDEKDSLLKTRGFHWISEFPFNR